MTNFPARAPFLVTVAVTLAAGLAGCATAPNGGPEAKSLSDLSHRGKSMLRLGEASRQAGDCVAAVRFYRLVKGGDDNKADLAAARNGAADCELTMNALPDARRDFQEAARLRPDDPAPLIGMGRVAVVAHNPGEAVSYFDMAIKKGGGDAAYVWNDQGVAYDQLRRHQEAQAAYRAGLAKFPTDRALRNNLALSLAMTGDFREAETLLRQLAAEPDASRRTRQNLALVLGLEGNTEEARNVAQADLDGAALDNNSRFYQYARARMTGEAVPAGDQAQAAPGRAGPVRHAEAAPLPPPVLVQQPRLSALRPAAPSRLETAALLPPPSDAPKPAIQTAALPPAVEAAPAAAPVAASVAAPVAESAPPAAPPQAAGTPTRVVARDGGALKSEPKPAAPVASSE